MLFSLHKYRSTSYIIASKGQVCQYEYRVIVCALQCEYVQYDKINLAVKTY
jgi:hypothetical protein